MKIKYQKQSFYSHFQLLYELNETTNHTNYKQRTP